MNPKSTENRIRFEEGQEVWLIPTRYWETQLPKRCVVCEPDDAKKKDDWILVFHDEYGHNTYVDPSRLFYDMKKAIRVAEHMKSIRELCDEDEGSELADRIIKKYESEREMKMNVKVNDSIEIKGVSKNDPDHEGRVIEITKEGVFIANLNMPYMGTYSNHFVKFEDIERVR